MILIYLFKWLIVDFKREKENKKKGIKKFKPFGLRLYCGPQGDGKTIGMVEQLNRWRVEYPDAIICTNFDYDYADCQLDSLNDLLTIRNGEKGVIFAIDELQNEFSSSVSKNFPETILGVITQQRKQRIVILGTSQVYMRVAKPLREQTFEVVDCRTYFNRLTRLRCYYADDYNSIVDKNDKVSAKMKLRKKWKYKFVQTDDLRNNYDTYSIVKRLSRVGFN